MSASPNARCCFKQECRNTKVRQGRNKIRLSRQENSDATHYCELCGRGPFCGKSGLKMHVTLMHKRAKLVTTCAVCGVPFDATNAQARYCGDECRDVARVRYHVRCSERSLEHRLSRTATCRCGREFNQFYAWQKRCLVCQSGGWTEEHYQTVLVEQNHRCAICGAHDTTLEREFDQDHDHKTGKPRGLLCQKCNIGLGYYDDDPGRVRAAAEYLESYATTS